MQRRTTMDLQEHCRKKQKKISKKLMILTIAECCFVFGFIVLSLLSLNTFWSTVKIDSPHLGPLEFRLSLLRLTFIGGPKLSAVANKFDGRLSLAWVARQLNKLDGKALYDIMHFFCALKTPRVSVGCQSMRWLTISSSGMFMATIFAMGLSVAALIVFWLCSTRKLQGKIFFVVVPTLFAGVTTIMVSFLVGFYLVGGSPPMMWNLNLALLVSHAQFAGAGRLDFRYDLDNLSATAVDSGAWFAISACVLSLFATHLACALRGVLS